MNKFKKHFQDNKKVYLAFGGGVVATAVVGYLALRTTAGSQALIKVQQIGWRCENNTVLIEFPELSTPSKPVHLKGTDLYWPSLSRCSRDTGHNLSRLSQNCNNKIPDINGDVFEFVEKFVEEAA